MRRAGKNRHIRDGFPVAMYETTPDGIQLAIPSGIGIGRYEFCWVVQGEIEFYVEENRYHLAQGQGISSIVAHCIWQKRYIPKKMPIFVWI